MNDIMFKNCCYLAKWICLFSRKKIMVKWGQGERCVKNQVTFVHWDQSPKKKTKQHEHLKFVFKDYHQGL